MESTTSFTLPFFRSVKRAALAVSATAVLSSQAMAAVTFTELPNENWGGSIAVSNEGTVAFAGDYGLYKWTRSTGTVELKTVDWGRTAGVSISDDGNTIAFTNATYYGGVQSSLVFNDGAEKEISGAVLNSSALLFQGRMSADGKYLSGMANNNPAFINLETDEVTVVEDIPGQNFIAMTGISNGAEGRLIKAQNGYTPFTFFQDGDAEPEFIDFTYSWGISSNGQMVLGEKPNCTDVETLGANLCAAVWDKSTKGIVEVGYFRPTSINRDGSIVTGNGWSDAPGAKVWDTFNGTRDIRDVLTSNGVDITGWTGFGSLTVSSDGTKFAGYATNPQGIKKPFVIEVIQECIGF